MESIEQSIMVAAPPERVWDVVTDWEARPRWAPRVEKAEILGGGPIRKGSRIRIQVEDRRFTPRVVEIHPPERLVIQIGSFAVRVRHTYEVRPDNGETILTLGVEYGGMFGGIVGRKMLGSSNRELDEELADLKRAVEGDGQV